MKNLNIEDIKNIEDYLRENNLTNRILRNQLKKLKHVLKNNNIENYDYINEVKNVIEMFYLLETDKIKNDKNIQNFLKKLANEINESIEIKNVEDKKEIFKKLFDNAINYNLYDYISENYEILQNDLIQKEDELMKKLEQYEEAKELEEIEKHALKYAEYKENQAELEHMQDEIEKFENVLDYLFFLKTGIIPNKVQSVVEDLIIASKEDELDLKIEIYNAYQKLENLKEQLNEYPEVQKILDKMIKELKNIEHDKNIKNRIEEFINKYSNINEKLEEYDILNPEVEEFIKNFKLEDYLIKLNDNKYFISKNFILNNFCNFIEENDLNIEKIMEGKIDYEEAINEVLNNKIEYNQNLSF